MTLKTLKTPNDFTPVDLLLFRTLRQEVPGLLEDTYARNLGLAALGPMPPRATRVLVDVPVPAKTPARAIVRLYD